MRSAKHSMNFIKVPDAAVVDYLPQLFLEFVQKLRASLVKIPLHEQRKLVLRRPPKIKLNGSRRDSGPSKQKIVKASACKEFFCTAFLFYYLVL